MPERTRLHVLPGRQGPILFQDQKAPVRHHRMNVPRGCQERHLLQLARSQHLMNGQRPQQAKLKEKHLQARAKRPRLKEKHLQARAKRPSSIAARPEGRTCRHRNMKNRKHMSHRKPGRPLQAMNTARPKPGDHPIMQMPGPLQGRPTRPKLKEGR